MNTSGKIPDSTRRMTNAEIEAAAQSDPDAQPFSDDDLRRMKRAPQVKIIRRALRLTQEEFAARYDISLIAQLGAGSQQTRPICEGLSKINCERSRRH